MTRLLQYLARVFISHEFHLPRLPHSFRGDIDLTVAALDVIKGLLANTHAHTHTHKHATWFYTLQATTATTGVHAQTCELPDSRF